MANKIAESLFQAVDILASAKISKLQFDKTLICIIENADNAAKGEYRVTDGSSHFLAYSENTSYIVGTKVYVDVPNGDMANQKIIVGKYNEEDNNYYTYISPLNDYIDITNNLIESNGEFTLLANHPEKKEILIWEKQNCSYIGYERMGVKGNFQTWLKSFNTYAGTFGLRIDITNENENGVDEFYSFYLDSNDMYGDPYNFETFYNQEQAFDITRVKEIKNIRLVAYQSANFIDTEGNDVPYQTTDGELYPDNIFIKDFYISFGYDVNSYNEDKVLIGTHSSLSYSRGKAPIEREIYLRWIHKSDDRFIAIDEMDEIPEDAKIHWYRYKLQQDLKDELAGVFWEEITDDVDDLFNYVFTPNYESQFDRFKAIVEIPSREYVNEHLTNNAGVLTNLQAIKNAATDINFSDLEEKVFKMCGLNSIYEINELSNEILELYEELRDSQPYNSIVNIILEEKANIQYYSSDDIEFTNEIDQQLETIDLIKGLTLICDEDGYGGIYRIYDETNNIVNSVEVNRYRRLTAVYSSLITGLDKLDMAEEITWFIPVDNTMIQYPVEGKEYDLENGDIFIPEEESGMTGYVAIQRKGNEIINDGENLNTEQLIEVNQIFRIKSYYTQSAKNNTIYCVVRKNGKDYEASVSLIFGTIGSNGSNMTFLLEMIDDEGQYTPAVTIGGTVNIKPRLYDYNNQEVDISEEDIRYSWFGENEGNGGVNAGFTNGYKVLKGNELLNISASGNISNCKYYILLAEITPDNDINGKTNKIPITLSSAMPIAVRSSEEYAEYAGPAKIFYEASGNSPRYYKDYIKIYDPSMNEYSGVTWSIDIKNSEDSVKYYPKIEEGMLIATASFIDGLAPFCINGKLNGATIWTQPILLHRNRFGTSLLNNWDGDLTIDEDNGIILSRIIGAGIKDTGNKFSGVVLGDVQATTDSTDTSTGIGLYGFQKGDQTYGFKVDGTAFIGKETVHGGRISFDGTEGLITGKGMSINLRTGLIEAENFKLNAPPLTIQSTSPYFKVTDLITISDREFSLNMDDSNATLKFNSSGLKITTGGESETTSFFGLTNSYFQVKLSNSNGESHLKLSNSGLSIKAGESFFNLTDTSFKVGTTDSYISLSNSAFSIKVGDNGFFSLSKNNFTVKTAESSLSLSNSGFSLNVGGESRFSLTEKLFNVNIGDASLSMKDDSFLLRVGAGEGHFKLTETTFNIKAGDTYLKMENDSFALSVGGNGFFKLTDEEFKLTIANEGFVISSAGPYLKCGDLFELSEDRVLLRTASTNPAVLIDSAAKDGYFINIKDTFYVDKDGNINLAGWIVEGDRLYSEYTDANGNIKESISLTGGDEPSIKVGTISTSITGGSDENDVNNDYFSKINGLHIDKTGKLSTSNATITNLKVGALYADKIYVNEERFAKRKIKGSGEVSVSFDIPEVLDYHDTFLSSASLKDPIRVALCDINNNITGNAYIKPIYSNSIVTLAGRLCVPPTLAAKQTQTVEVELSIPNVLGRK